MKYRRIPLGAALGALLVASGATAFAREQTEKQTPTAQTATTPAPVFDPAVARRITVEDLVKHIDARENILYVDTRYMPTGPIVKGAEIVTFENTKAWAAGKPKDALIVTYCTCHNEATSSRMVLELQKLGFTNAYALLGGLTSYETANLPTAPSPTPKP